MSTRSYILAATTLFWASSLLANDKLFESEIAPILVKRCLECHNARSNSGGLTLVSAETFARGGESGKIVDGDGSELLERVIAGEMPPEKQGKSQKLSMSEVASLKRWIAQGASWPKDRVLDLYESTNEVRGGRDWWSFQQIQRPGVPIVRRYDVANPIDAFVLKRLQDAKLEPAPLAPNRVLVRRLRVDTHGLNPSADELDELDGKLNWSQQVEAALASPQFGERWARHWLDVVRYAETCGYERDQVKPFVWKYRDWVVNSLNSGMPYDQFIMHQIAGDELPQRTKQSLVATGFLRLGTWNDEPNDPHEYKYERLEDMVHSTSSAFLGLTVKCARCHDHKFDPILQLDYYRMASAFWAGSIEPANRGQLGGPNTEQLGHKDVFGWTDVGPKPTPFRLLKNGNPKHPLEVVEPAALSTIVYLKSDYKAPSHNPKTSGRRYQLAKWITDCNNPLTARVAVNRIWQNYFGEGLVRTPNNFGFRGAPPTHPLLLDWLAAELVSSGWNVKHIHRLILNSFTYRRSAIHPRQAEYAIRDSSNQLLWRGTRRRLDAESLRDAQLQASGRLDLRQGGKSFNPTISSDALEGLSRKSSAWVASPPDQQRRRSLYIHTKRGLLPPVLTTFDFSDTTLPCAQRDITTVAPQALAMMNNAFTHEQSSFLAHAIVSEHSADRASQITRAWRRILKRTPTPAEYTMAEDFLKSQQEAFALQQSPKPPRPNQKAMGMLTPTEEGLVLHLRADKAEVDEQGRVTKWGDLSGRNHHASQDEGARRPLRVSHAIGGRAAIRFDGKKRFLAIAGQLLSREECTIFAVVSDQAQHTSHREVISNWNSKGNSTTSIFLGLTKNATVRFSDVFGQAGKITNRQLPFLLSAVNQSTGATVFQNQRQIGGHPTGLGGRRLDTPWVIGQQGNIDGEYWAGDMAEILVYDRALSQAERGNVETYLLKRYKLKGTPNARLVSPDELALASLCHVLFNSNEFIYVD